MFEWTESQIADHPQRTRAIYNFKTLAASGGCHLRSKYKIYFENLFVLKQPYMNILRF